MIDTRHLWKAKEKKFLSPFFSLKFFPPSRTSLSLIPKKTRTNVRRGACIKVCVSTYYDFYMILLFSARIILVSTHLLLLFSQINGGARGCHTRCQASKWLFFEKRKQNMLKCCSIPLLSDQRKTISSFPTCLSLSPPSPPIFFLKMLNRRLSTLICLASISAHTHTSIASYFGIISELREKYIQNNAARMRWKEKRKRGQLK